MKKILTLSLLLIAAIGYNASAQTVLYTQNFDSSLALPTGWYATPNSWYVDSSSGNASSGYTGVSGLNNVVIKDSTTNPGIDSLITSAISTVGFDSITIEWGTRFSKHFADSGSTVNLYWSANDSAWNLVTFTEDSNNSVWELDNRGTPILLPTGASNRASLRLMYVADVHFGPSGTYRIDDLVVAGDSIPATVDSALGIATISANSFANVFVSGGTTINISVIQAISGNVTAGIYDMTGRLMDSINMTSQTLMMDEAKLSAGVYIVQVAGSNTSLVKKVLIK